VESNIHPGRNAVQLYLGLQYYLNMRMKGSCQNHQVRFHAPSDSCINRLSQEDLAQHGGDSLFR